MEYVPEEVWHIRHQRRLRELEQSLRHLETSSWSAACWTARCVGCAVGFGAVWLAYLLFDWFVCFAYTLTSWVARGFRAPVTEQVQPKEKKRPELKLTDILFILRPFVVAALILLLAALIAFLVYYYG